MKDTLKDDVDTAIEEIVGLRSNIQVIDETLSEIVSDLHSISYRISTQNEENEKENSKKILFCISRVTDRGDSMIHDQFWTGPLEETQIKKLEELLNGFSHE